MSPRLRRLLLDYDRLQKRFANCSVIRIIEAVGNPPEQYRVEFMVKGLEIVAGGKIQERNQHLVEINLSLGYPRRMPQCKILTPIFHPNFDQTSICIGDFWAASEGLDDLLVRIARLIAYQEYNTKSPLNGLAAKWAMENQGQLPVDRREMAPMALEEAEPVLKKEVHISDSELGDAYSSDESIARTAVVGNRVMPAVPAVVPSDPDAKPVQANRRVDEIVNLAPELSLLHLRVRCDRCKYVFDLELSLLQAPVVCPKCAFQHETGKTYKCVAVESAGLFWFQDV